MAVIRLGHRDIYNMVENTVRAVLSESVSETMGSAMAEKEDTIQEIVNFVKRTWLAININDIKPDRADFFTFDDVPDYHGRVKIYSFSCPSDILADLDIAKNFELDIEIANYIFDEKYLKYMGANERGTEGGSVGGGKYGLFDRATLKMEYGRIYLTVPAINGQLQTKGLHSTLYHELNHSYTQVKIKRDKTYLPDDDMLHQLNLTNSNNRQSPHPHNFIQSEMSPDPVAQLVQSIRYGSDVEPYRAMNFIFYSIWERTELNARAEEMYGNLKALKATRQAFGEIYPQTSVYHNIQELKELLDTVRPVPPESRIWEHAAVVMNMNPRSKKGIADTRFFKKVKERFISRSEELLDTLYKKAMKVAELYFQKHEPKPEPTRLERYKKEHNK